MAGGIVETDPEKLAQHCESFMAGAKKLFDEGDGDMWLFELYHHLNDCAALLRSFNKSVKGTSVTIGKAK